VPAGEKKAPTYINIENIDVTLSGPGMTKSNMNTAANRQILADSLSGILDVTTTVTSIEDVTSRRLSDSQRHLTGNTAIEVEYAISPIDITSRGFSDPQAAFDAIKSEITSKTVATSGASAFTRSLRQNGLNGVSSSSANVPGSFTVTTSAPTAAPVAAVSTQEQSNLSAILGGIFGAVGFVALLILVYFYFVKGSSSKVLAGQYSPDDLEMASIPVYETSMKPDPQTMNNKALAMKDESSSDESESSSVGNDSTEEPDNHAIQERQILSENSVVHKIELINKRHEAIESLDNAIKQVLEESDSSSIISSDYDSEDDSENMYTF
jgi:hypothetical protein